MLQACTAVAVRLVLTNLFRGDGREKVFAIYSGRRSASPRECPPRNSTAPKRFFPTRDPIHPNDVTLRFASTPCVTWASIPRTRLSVKLIVMIAVIDFSYRIRLHSCYGFGLAAAAFLKSTRSPMEFNQLET